MYKENAPIVLFVYNRLSHTKQVIDALKKNGLSRSSDLFVYSDGWKNDKSKKDVLAVREYINTIAGFKSVTIVEREANYGLKKNIIEGVTEVVDRYGKIIVLEDDILVTPFFLKYMNDALDFYNGEERVMEVSASHEYMDTTQLPETFLIKKGFCHGWGTWQRAWDKYDKSEEAIDIFKRFDCKRRRLFNLYGATDEFGEVIDNCLGRLNTWAVFWDVAIFENNGLVVVPRDNMIINIGFDGSGEHCPKTTRHINAYATQIIESFPEEIKEDEQSAQRYRDGCMDRRPDFAHRVHYRIERCKDILRIQGMIRYSRMLNGHK